MIFFFVTPLIANCQLKIDSLSVIKDQKQFKNIFKKYLNLDVRDEIYIDFSDNKHGYLPPIWDYNNDNHRLKHNEYFANINKNSLFIVLHHSGVIGEYILYLNKNIAKSWIQVNEVPDSVSLNYVINDIYYFELISFNEMEERTDKRYIFVSAESGRVGKSLLDAYNSSLKIKFIDTAKRSVIFQIDNSVNSETGTLILDIANLDFKVSDTTCCIIQDIFYSPIRSIKNYKY